ncbi:tumor necrosis factor receptor superfamily member 19L-like isoform X3 [Narcine bancroftii]|uniref:tumor necrosis factor receptor superfamily member 19L-like isoform X3 n=1 Tax=Narcine bancroftii TaxID=1343680 RepID=UPI003831A72F
MEISPLFQTGNTRVPISKPCSAHETQTASGGAHTTADCRQGHEMESDSGEEEMAGPQNLYTILLVILIFFITGLLGILLCHILQEKGYRCRTSQQLDVEQNTPAATTDDVQESNQDTVGQIVQCILDNKANAEALKEMLKEHEEMQPLSHRFRVTHMDRGRAADEQNSIPTDQPSGGTHSEGPVTGEGQQVAAAE